MDPEIKANNLWESIFNNRGTGSLGNKIVREIIKYSPKK